MPRATAPRLAQRLRALHQQIDRLRNRRKAIDQAIAALEALEASRVEILLEGIDREHLTLVPARK